MNKIILTIAALAVNISLISASEGGNRSLKVKSENSKINWKGSKPAGDHTGTVKISEGTIHLKDGLLTGGKFTIDLRTIVNDDVKSAEWNKKLVDHLKSEDFFYVEKYPSASFEISKADLISDSKYNVTGILTIKNISKSISFNADVKLDKGKITATTEDIVIDRTQWKVEAMSKSIFSDLKDNFVDDNMVISVYLTAE